MANRPRSNGRCAGDRRAQLQRAIDQRSVTEGLGNVAEKTLGSGIVLLGHQADIVAKREEPLESFFDTLSDDESAQLDLTSIDKAGPQLEKVLWESVRPDPVPGELQRRLSQPQPLNDD